MHVKVRVCGFVWPSPSRSREPLAKTHERQRGTPCSFPFDFWSGRSPMTCDSRWGEWPDIDNGKELCPEDFGIVCHPGTPNPNTIDIERRSTGRRNASSCRRDFCFCYGNLYHCTRCELVPQRVTVGCHPTVTHYCGLHRHMNAWVALHTSHGRFHSDWPFFRRPASPEFIIYLCVDDRNETYRI